MTTQQPPPELQEATLRLARAAYQDDAAQIAIALDALARLPVAGGLPWALMTLIDWLAATAGVTPDRVARTRLVVQPSDGDSASDIDEVPPALAWAARLTMARLSRDDAMVDALLHAVPDDDVDALTWLVELCRIVGYNIRRVSEGKHLLQPMRKESSPWP